MIHRHVWTRRQKLTSRASAICASVRSARRDMFLSLVKPTLLKARSNSWQNFFFSILESNGKTLWGLIAKRKNQSAKGLELYVWVLDSKPHFVNKLGLQLSGCLDAVICWWVSTPLWIGWSKRNSPLKSLLPTCPALCLVATEGIVYTMFLSQFLEKSQLDNIFLNHTFYSSYNLLSTDVSTKLNTVINTSGSATSLLKVRLALTSSEIACRCERQPFCAHHHQCFHSQSLLYMYTSSM